MKKYLVTVVCTDASTISKQVIVSTKKEACYFLMGVCHVLEFQGKEIYLRTVKPVKP